MGNPVQTVSKNIDTKIVVSVIAAAFVGMGIVMAVRMLPDNSITTPAKQVVETALG